MSYQIREADSTDVSELTLLIRNAYRDVAVRFRLTPANCPKHPSNCTDDWVDNDFSRGVRYFILEGEDMPLGCVAIEHAGDNMCYLERLAVLPQERRKGLGCQLVEHVFQVARKLGSKTIGIGIIDQQTDLKQWYHKIGFIEGETSTFDHLPFMVRFMSYKL
jgi:N-acetylglutamate synthase-like GNAT family acetyltransferase